MQNIVIESIGWDKQSSSEISTKSVLVGTDKGQIFELMVKYQDKEKVIMIHNKYVPVKPTEWRDRFNVSVVVGLGTGSKEQQIIMLNNNKFEVQIIFANI